MPAPGDTSHGVENTGMSWYGVRMDGQGNGLSHPDGCSGTGVLGRRCCGAPSDPVGGDGVAGFLHRAWAAAWADQHWGRMAYLATLRSGHESLYPMTGEASPEDCALDAEMRRRRVH